MRKFVAVACTASIVVTLVGMASARGTVPGRNGRIAFRRYFDLEHTWGAIFTMNADGTGIHQVTHPTRGHLTTEPEWSPDGRWIAFWTGDEDTGRIWKIRANGTERTYLSSSCTDACHADLGPSFSPDGSQIVFTRATGCGAGHVPCLVAVYVMAADGSDVRQVTQIGASTDKHNRFEDNWAQWLPDGNGFVFERRDNRQHHHRYFRHAIFTTLSDGTGLTRLTPWWLDAAQPDVSPDGQWILFRSHETGGHQNNLYLVHPDGSDLHRITNDAGGTYTWASYSFSPDETMITAARSPGAGAAGYADIYVMQVDGTGLQDITNSRIWDSAPDWGPVPTG